GLARDLTYARPFDGRTEVGERVHDALAALDACGAHAVQFGAKRHVLGVHEQPEDVNLGAGDVAGEFDARDEGHAGVTRSRGTRFLDALERVVIGEGKDADAIRRGEVHEVRRG